MSTVSSSSKATTATKPAAPTAGTKASAAQPAGKTVPPPKRNPKTEEEEEEDDDDEEEEDGDDDEDRKEVRKKKVLDFLTDPIFRIRDPRDYDHARENGGTQLHEKGWYFKFSGKQQISFMIEMIAVNGKPVSMNVFEHFIDGLKKQDFLRLAQETGMFPKPRPSGSKQGASANNSAGNGKGAAIPRTKNWPGGQRPRGGRGGRRGGRGGRGFGNASN